MIHAIIWGFVLISGAGISISGPITLIISAVNLRVNLSSSLFESLLGSTHTPPFAPPKGRFSRLFFQVIHIARALTSSRKTPSEYRNPPFPGPRTVEWCTLYPSKTSRSPLSIIIGIETINERSILLRYFLMFSSKPIFSATMSNCFFAISNGFLSILILSLISKSSTSSVKTTSFL